MNTMFPFGFDLPVMSYLALYLLTLVIHAVFMSYVLAGSVWLAWATVCPGRGAVPRARQPLALVMRDWMPFVLSAAITAAVAPLLFVQVIYRQQFYTANLLLGWRWMVVVPVLIAAFYLLYLLKSRIVNSWSYAWSVAVGIGTAACFVFVAFCWSTNHLLSIETEGWADAYHTGAVVSSISVLLLRLSMWIAGTFAVMPVLTGWQLAGRTQARADTPPDHSAEAVRLACIALGGLFGAAALGATYVLQLSGEQQALLTGPAGWPWLVVAGAGAATAVAAWALQLQTRRFGTLSLATATCGTTVLLIGVAFLRELIRLSAVGLRIPVANVESAARIGGVGVFLSFTVINVILITVCLRVVSRGRDR